jgi:DNA replication initiation complex subunit (GINS family)
MSEREAFEKWARDKAHLDSFEVNGEKRYAAMTANIMWAAWQAAKAESVPDANLMAAAHDLHDALDTIIESFQSSFLRNDHVENAVRAIAKARGNNPTLSTTTNQ